ncbi:MAG TPA: response regulator [Anaerolineae bacterium]|nr:response regulator [Anaerolineae bacterium]HQH37898.1 response regulator [Anaerolineae bacterium]
MDGAASSPANILIVDDTLFNVQFLADILTREGYAVQTATSGELALEAVQTLVPNLILLDIMMPGLSGYEVCERLKSQEKTCHVPVIFISALNQELDKVRAFAVGGVDYISKPFQIKEILARIETHLTLRRLQQQLEENNASLQQEIVERTRVEADLRHYVERLRILREIDQSIVAAQSPETIAVAAIGRIRQLIPAARVIVMALTNNGVCKTLAAESSGELTLEIDEKVYREVLDNSVLRAGRVQGIPDLRELTTLSPLQQRLLSAGVGAYIIVPLFVHDQLVGTLHLESCHPAAFDAAHITIATEVAASLAIAIHQAYLYELAQQEIAERTLAEEALRQQTVELEARNAELDAFAHTVAHDLKTPITALVGFSDLLQRQYMQMPLDKLGSTLGIIAQNGRRMSNIINELLLLASVRKMDDVPMYPLDMKRIVIAVLKERVNDLLKTSMAQVILSETWPQAYGYGPWIEEVWLNYISNAIKYGGNPPRLELGATPLPDGMVRFWVRDNGRGLTPDEQSQLFTAFTRLQQTSVEGHGLGLSIVQRIVTKLRGGVGVESTVGQGSEFFFTLPSVWNAEVQAS